MSAAPAQAKRRSTSTAGLPGPGRFESDSPAPPGPARPAVVAVAQDRRHNARESRAAARPRSAHPRSSPPPAAAHPRQAPVRDTAHRGATSRYRRVLCGPARDPARFPCLKIVFAGPARHTPAAYRRSRGRGRQRNPPDACQFRIHRSRHPHGGVPAAGIRRDSQKRRSLRHGSRPDRGFREPRDSVPPDRRCRVVRR